MRKNGFYATEEQQRQMVYTGVQFMALADEAALGPRPYPMTYVMNASFGVELLLKALVSILGKAVPHTHDLHYLYRCIDTATQTDLQGRWGRYYDVNLAQLQMAQAPHLTVPVTLQEALLEGATAFEEWRYHYEGKAKSGFHLPMLAAACSWKIGVLKPDWDYGGLNLKWNPMTVDYRQTRDKARYFPDRQ